MLSTFSHLGQITAEKVVLTIVSQKEHFTSCLSCMLKKQMKECLKEWIVQTGEFTETTIY